MVERVDKAVSTRPLTMETVLDGLNLEFIPLLRKIRAAINSLLDQNLSGTGSPEGVVLASRGARYAQTDGGAGTSFWVKESGDQTNTGWVAK